jgi:hypothetical protein
MSAANASPAAIALQQGEQLINNIYEDYYVVATTHISTHRRFGLSTMCGRLRDPPAGSEAVASRPQGPVACCKQPVAPSSHVGDVESKETAHLCMCV